MNSWVVLYLAVLAVALAQARMTNRQLLKLAKPADDSVKADHDVELQGGLDDEVDFQSILKQMGYDFNLEGQAEVDINISDDLEGLKNADGTNADLDANVKAGECACSGATCVCCCVLTFTYEGKTYYIQICVRVTHTGSSYYVELFLQGEKKYATSVSRPTTITYTLTTYFKFGIHIYEVSSTRFCFYLFFWVNGTYYKCQSYCATFQSDSRLGSILKKYDI